MNLGVLLCFSFCFSSFGVQALHDKSNQIKSNGPINQQLAHDIRTALNSNKLTNGMI
jgi:hypothetical protein